MLFTILQGGSLVDILVELILIMPVILIGMVKLGGADFAANFTTPVGIVCTTIAIGAFVGAYMLGRKILSIEV